jgi:hypothetical protein
MDKREAILARLLVIAGTVSGITTVVRNTAQFNEKALPAITIFDADEEAEGGASQKGQAPTVVSMTPEIWIVLGDTKANVGTALNAVRAALVKAILTDATLETLVGSNGGMVYLGCSTGLSRARDMVGEMGVSLRFQYALIPSQL